MPDVVLEQVEKRYGSGGDEVQALLPIDLGIDHGELVAVVGPSGCGKSTMLRTIAGLEPPSGGQVVVGGRPVWSGTRPDPDALAHLAVVFQEPNLLPWFDVEDNVALPLRLSGVGREQRRARAREICALVGIDGFEGRRPSELSIGMRQRASLGRALIAEPDILLLDEPFAALDAITREQMNVELQRVWMASPTTCLLVTHSMAEAVFLADRVVSLTARPGRIAGETTIPFERPRALDVQRTEKFQDLVHEIRARLAQDR